VRSLAGLLTSTLIGGLLPFGILRRLGTGFAALKRR
jgi:hypothetical protein